ncbi:MAG: Asp-tRNA(Asn)/Glu-tRNA(Gln) amidotransferase subunit GatC [Synergistaceae bacterium]|jgi:aspartyl/glutamyl-tRNA(Asn/Gln) amidotransferase C subunit|nr:Asp-tRNA(Asn)/Glu-tRNA(Gln) amidotransferase subunit GatC [Synergistaceae bacterium]
MKLGEDDVRAIADEARLSLTDAELVGAVRYINNFLEMVDRFKELDLKDVEPFCFAETNVCPLRKDVPAVFPDAKDILAERTRDMGSFFKVPRIVEDAVGNRDVSCEPAMGA